MAEQGLGNKLFIQHVQQKLANKLSDIQSLKTRMCPQYNDAPTAATM